MNQKQIGEHNRQDKILPTFSSLVGMEKLLVRAANGGSNLLKFSQNGKTSGCGPYAARILIKETKRIKNYYISSIAYSQKDKI